MGIEVLLQMLLNEYPTSKDHQRAVRSVEKLIKEYAYKTVDVCDILLEMKKMRAFSVTTQLFKNACAYKEKENFIKVKKWSSLHLSDWGCCNQFCYRILNPMVEEFPELFDEICAWQITGDLYRKRSIAVCILHSAIEFEVRVPFSYVKKACDILKYETHLHLQKAVGWLLKYAYHTYPDEVISYLQENKLVLSRITLRCACEKMIA